MSKAEWVRHRANVLATADATFAVEDTKRSVMVAHVAMGCKTCEARRTTRRANLRRRERDDAMRSCGLVKTPYGWE